MERTFQESTLKISQNTDESITKTICNQLDIKLGLFMQEELDVLLRKVKNGKATGLNEIPPEVWKAMKFDDILLRYLQYRI